MTISKVFASTELYGDLSAAEGTPTIWVATLCEIGSNPQMRLTTDALPLFPALVLELRGYDGVLSELFTLDDVEEGPIIGIGEGRRLTVVVSSGTPNPEQGFCLLIGP